MTILRSASFILLAGLILVLSGCGSVEKHQDLKDYIEETKRRPAGRIDPLPPFVPYKPFNYSAMALNSPFSPPADIVQHEGLGVASNVAPDAGRAKEFLEKFKLGSLRMVGSLQLAGVRWALVNDGRGSVHKVAEGNYLGKNHGRIVLATERKIEVIEIVPNGAKGWVERPQTLRIVEKE